MKKWEVNSGYSDQISQYVELKDDNYNIQN